MTLNDFVSLVQNMAQLQENNKSSKLSSYDAYFEKIQSRKKLPKPLQETLTSAFSNIPVSSFPGVPVGKGNKTITQTISSINNLITHKLAKTRPY